MMLNVKNKDQLLKLAKEKSDSSPKIYRKIVEKYYIARYFTILFQSRNQSLPIQVWNSYKNSYDGFFKHITSDNLGQDNLLSSSNNIKDMDFHLTRAMFDILQLFSYSSDEWFEKEFGQYKIENLNLVDNTTFLKTLLHKRNHAQSLFSNAQHVDGFGHSSDNDCEIMNNYLDAAFAYEDLRSFFESKMPDIQRMLVEHQNIHTAGKESAKKDAFFPNVGASLTATIIWTILGLIIGSLISVFGLEWMGIIEYING